MSRCMDVSITKASCGHHLGCDNLTLLTHLKLIKMTLKCVLMQQNNIQQ